jgi:hypothetical protein
MVVSVREIILIVESYIRNQSYKTTMQEFKQKYCEDAFFLGCVSF